MAVERLEDRTVLSTWTFGIADDPSFPGTVQPGAVQADGAGNTYVAGTFHGTVDFDPAASTAVLTSASSAGFSDIFLAKYSPVGALGWVRQWTPNSQQMARATLDGDGNIYLTGSFGGSITLGTMTLVSSGAADAFVAKIDGSTGDVNWAQRIGATAWDSGSAIAVDTVRGAVWVTGSSNSGVAFASADVFVAQLDATTGAVTWTGQMGGPGTDHSSRMVLDGQGDVYISGSFAATSQGIATSVDFDPGPGDYSKATTDANGDAFLVKLNSSGALLWVNSFNRTGEDFALGLAVDGSGNVSLSTILSQTNSGSLTLDVDPGPGVTNVTGQSALATYASNGALIGGTGLGVSVYNLDVDEQGNIYGSGYFSSSADFNPGPGIVRLASAGSSDGAVFKLDANRNLVWARRLGGSADENASRIAVDSSGHVHVSGGTGGAADFPTGDNLPSSGAFLMKLEQLPSGQLSVATITGTAFNDENQNGLPDDPYATPPPSTVYLDTNNNGVPDAGEPSTTTYASGLYSFNALAAGTFPVRQVVPTGWVQTAPVAHVHQVTIDFGTGADQLAAGRDFGNYNLNPPTKFYVVNDGSPDRTYEYRGNGGAIENYAINSGNSAPRGVASTAAGDKVWVVDANKNVYVYNTSGGLLGSWSLGGMPGKVDVQGIATNGTDIWIVDAKFDIVYRYAGAASRLSGSQAFAGNFSLNSGNTNPKDMVLGQTLNGQALWVVDDGATDRVFVYQAYPGTQWGNWTINGGGGSPTGITVDPTNVSNIWIVDIATDRVYQFDAAASRTGGSQSPSASFPLSAGNSNPQGIADPPAPRAEFVSADVAADSNPLIISGPLPAIRNLNDSSLGSRRVVIDNRANSSKHADLPAYHVDAVFALSQAACSSDDWAIELALPRDRIHRPILSSHQIDSDLDSDQADAVDRISREVAPAGAQTA